MTKEKTRSAYRDARQQFCMKDIAKSGLTCKDCRMFKDGVCTNTLINQEKIDLEAFNMCLRPNNEILLSAVNKIKKFLSDRPEEVARNRKAAMYLQAAVDRYEGAPEKAVINDYKLISDNKGYAQTMYSMYIRRGIAFAARSAITEKEAGALAKWVVDEKVNVLTDWNPFDTDVSAIKRRKLKDFGNAKIGRTTYLDGIPYRILDQDSGNLFVAMETPEDEFTGTDGWYVGSDLDHFMNNEWLEAHPEAKTRLVHRVRTLTAQNLAKYPVLGECPIRYWISVMPDDEAGEGYGALADGLNILRAPVDEKHFVRPAFWIAPSETELVEIKTRVEKAVNAPVKKNTAKNEPKAVQMKQTPVSELLNVFKDSEDLVFGEDMPDDERTILEAHFKLELQRLFKNSGLSRQDFDILCGVHAIATKLDKERREKNEK